LWVWGREQVEERAHLKEERGEEEKGGKEHEEEEVEDHLGERGKKK